MISAEDFYQQTVGKKKDVDGVYGYQCVDLFKWYCQLQGIPVLPAGGDGYADNYWLTRSRYAKYFDFITNPNDLRTGDWCFWYHRKRNAKSSKPISHVAMCYIKNGVKYMYGMNQSAGREACLKTTTWDIAGAFRLKGATKMEIKDGINALNYDGVAMTVVRGYGNYKQVHLWSAKDSLQDIKDLNGDEGNKTILTVLAKVNCNYFNMNNGDHLGLEQGDNFEIAHLDQAGFLVFYQLNNGTCGYCKSPDYWYRKSDVIFACSPYAVRIHNGQFINAKSTACGEKDDLCTTQTVAWMDDSGKWYLAISNDNCFPRTMQSLAQACCNVKEMIILDGGGSTQMIYNGKVVKYTGRKLPNVLCLAKLAENTANTGNSGKNEEPSTEPENTATAEAQAALEEAKKKNSELLAENTDLKIKLAAANTRADKILLDVKQARNLLDEALKN